MATSGWCIVEFDDGVQLVPKNWLNGNNCFWPTFKSTSRYEKAVRSCETPQDAWSQYPARILGTYSSYESAKPKLKLAEEQSDLNTDNEQSKKLRKIKKRKAFSSSEDESAEDDYVPLKDFPRPPTKVNKTPLEKRRNLQSKEYENDYYGSDAELSSCAVQPFPARSKANTAPPELRRNILNKENVNDYYGSDAELSCAVSVACSTPVSVVSHSSSRVESPQVNQIQSDLVFKRTVCRDLSFIKVNVIKLNQRLALFEVPSHVNVAEETLQLEELDGIFKNTFPLNTVESVNEIESKLQTDMEFKLKLIRFCSRIGGYKLDEIVKLILRRLFSNKLASLYSWLGAKKKRVFSQLCLVSDVIMNSVRANKPAASATDKEIIDCIKNWLRHASTRYHNDRKKSISREGNTSQEDNISQEGNTSQEEFYE